MVIGWAFMDFQEANSLKRQIDQIDTTHQTLAEDIKRRRLATNDAFDREESVNKQRWRNAKSHLSDHLSDALTRHVDMAMVDPIKGNIVIAEATHFELQDKDTQKWKEMQRIEKAPYGCNYAIVRFDGTMRGSCVARGRSKYPDELDIHYDDISYMKSRCCINSIHITHPTTLSDAQKKHVISRCESNDLLCAIMSFIDEGIMFEGNDGEIEHDGDWDDDALCVMTATNFNDNIWYAFVPYPIDLKSIDQEQVHHAIKERGHRVPENTKTVEFELQ